MSGSPIKPQNESSGGSDLVTPNVTQKLLNITGLRGAHCLLIQGESNTALLLSAAAAFVCGQNPETGSGEYQTALTHISAGTNPEVFGARSFCIDNTHKADKNNPVKYHIEGIRRLIADTASRPNRGKIKVYLFDKAEELSPQCQNALLKTVEEPGYCRFVFAAEDSSPLLPTLLSRLTALQITGKKAETTLGKAESENLFSIIAANRPQREYDMAKAFAAIGKKKDRQLVTAVLDRLIEHARAWDETIGVIKRAQITEALIEFRFRTKLFPNFNLSAAAYAARIGEILGKRAE
jgi:DNA polymerase III delta prime subunit